MQKTSDSRLSEALLERLAQARSVLVLTGAGMSAESGIPTFRDAQTGIWSRFRPEELATPEAFAANPARVWQWYEERRKMVRQAQPHAGHRALVELMDGENLILGELKQNLGRVGKRGTEFDADIRDPGVRSFCRERGGEDQRSFEQDAIVEDVADSFINDEGFEAPLAPVVSPLRGRPWRWSTRNWRPRKRREAGWLHQRVQSSLFPDRG